MGLIDLKFRNTTVSIVADDEQKTLNLAGRLNHRLDALAANGGSFTADSKIAFIAGLLLEDELDRLRAEVRDGKQDNSKREAGLEVSEALDQVSEYIESLAERIEKK